MGFNLSGLAINQNYKDSFDQLQKGLGWTLKKESDINFETASSNWKEDGICDVYFSENGTLLFISGPPQRRRTAHSAVDRGQVETLTCDSST